LTEEEQQALAFDEMKPSDDGMSYDEWEAMRAVKCIAALKLLRRCPSLFSPFELLNILKTAVGTGTKADASLQLADQLIAAKLNIANGSDPAPVSSTITHADSLLSGFSGKLPYKVKTSSAIGQQMVNAGNTLGNYNNGSLTPVCSP
jgi:hypothetical protein